jgi:hypothetical protein
MQSIEAFYICKASSSLMLSKPSLNKEVFFQTLWLYQQILNRNFKLLLRSPIQRYEHWEISLYRPEPTHLWRISKKVRKSLQPEIS